MYGHAAIWTNNDLARLNAAPALYGKRPSRASQHSCLTVFEDKGLRGKGKDFRRRDRAALVQRMVRRRVVVRRPQYELLVGDAMVWVRRAFRRQLAVRFFLSDDGAAELNEVQQTDRSQSVSIVANSFRLRRSVHPKDLQWAGGDDLVLCHVSDSGFRCQESVREFGADLRPEVCSLMSEACD